MTGESKKCKLTCQIELLAFLNYHVMCCTQDLLCWVSPHPPYPFCSKSVLHFFSCTVAVLLPWGPTCWMDRADCAHLWSAGPSHLPRSVPGLQTTAVTCVCNPRSCLFQGCWEAQVPLSYHTCDTPYVCPSVVVPCTRYLPSFRGIRFRKRRNLRSRVLTCLSDPLLYK